jgi:hypothetical protein
VGAWSEELIMKLSFQGQVWLKKMWKRFGVQRVTLVRAAAGFCAERYEVVVEVT